MSSTGGFLFGTIAALSFVAGLFFIRFYRRTGDRFFLLFSITFFLMGVNRCLMALYAQSTEAQHSVFLLRLAASLVLLGAILDKNRRSSGEQPPEPPGPRMV